MSELLTPEILRNRISGKNEDRIQNIFLSVIIFLLCIYIFLNNFVFATVYVSGDSMLPNFVDGQYLVGNRFEAFVGDFEYGDVVVVNVEFKDDGTIDNNGKKIIKRIVGLPGDVIDFKNGKLVRNGEVVIEDYIPSSLPS